ncbi:iron-containing redox enzyme family protein [Leptospira sp. 96542]|nr:iron-containing redox enzyme family protein [Leptospira sp. 96542]
MNDLVLKLQNDVKNHPVLESEWIIRKQNKMDLDDLLLWLSQEYFVSIGFVDWFLIVAAKTTNQRAKIVLVENIWEELGEGKIEDTHVSILIEFLAKLGVNYESNQILPETKLYLDKMSKIINQGFYFGLGALGPANEYLLKLEYSKISDSYQILKTNMNLPEGKFFQVNLDADEGHSKRLFDLIADTALEEQSKNEVILGNKMALDARKLFYEGLIRVELTKT